MAVTINELDVEVRSPKSQEQPAAEAALAKDALNLRQETEKLAERELRLKAD